MFRFRAFASALLCSLLIMACVQPEPDADGRALGELHVKLLNADELTVEQYYDDLRKADQRHETAEARRSFETSYRQALRPARGKLAALMLKDAGQKTEEAFRELREEIGEEFKDLTRDISESVKDAAPDKDELRESLKGFGRELGKTIREVSEGIEAIADGVDEELSGDKKQ